MNERPTAVLDVGTGHVTELKYPKIDGAIEATFSRDGRRLVVTSGFGGATVFRVRHNGVDPAQALNGVASTPSAAAFSPDGRLLAIGSQNGTIQLLDAQTFRALGSPSAVAPGIIIFVAFSPDSRLLIAQSLDATNRLFDVEHRAPIGDAFPGSGAGFGIAELLAPQRHRRVARPHRNHALGPRRRPLARPRLQARRAQPHASRMVPVPLIRWRLPTHMRRMTRARAHTRERSIVRTGDPPRRTARDRFDRGCARLLW